MTFPGEMSFPGEMTLPGREPMQAAVRAAQATLRAGGAEHGFFFVVFAKENDMTGQGLGLPTRPA